MTASPADRQRLKRQRRAEAGMVKVEVWLSPESAAQLKDLKQGGWTNDQAFTYALSCAASG